MNPANKTSQTHAPSNPLAEGAEWPSLRHRPSGGSGLRNWIPAMILTLFLLPGHSWGDYQAPPNAVLKDLVSSRSKSDGTDPDGDTKTLVCSKDANGKVKLQISLEQGPSGTYEWVIKKGAQEIVKATASVNQGDRLQSGNSFTVTKEDLVIAPELHTLEVTQSGGFKRRIDFVIVEFITPAGDPVIAPVDDGSDGTNEFTFSTATAGVLTMELKAKVAGIGSWSETEKNKFKFELDGIGASSFAWKIPDNTGGKVSASGDFITATATYTGLPQSNGDFGLKNARVKYDGNKVSEAKFEVFFSRDATNHPGGQAGSPNWYHYWSEALGVTGNHTYNAALMTSLTTSTATTSQIEIAPNANWPNGNPPTNEKHINGFWATNLHENWHKAHHAHNFSVHGAGSPPQAEDSDLDGICDREPGDPPGHGGGWEAQIATDPNTNTSHEVGGENAEAIGTYNHGPHDWSNPGTNNKNN